MFALLLATVLRAAGHDVVCLEPGLCTPVVRLDGERVRHTDRLPARIDPTSAFAGWMVWPHPPEDIRLLVQRRAVADWRVALPGTRLRLALVPGVVTEPAGVLAFLSSDPLQAREGPGRLPESVAAAESLELLDAAQRSEVAHWRSSLAAWRNRLASAWTAFTRAPHDAGTRSRLLEAMTGEPPVPTPERLLTAAQRTELRRRGHALEGRIVLEDLPGDAYRLRVEGVPLDQLVEDWNAGLRALVSRLERVPRPRLRVVPGHRHDEVSLAFDVRSDVDETRLSQVSRRLSQVPGIEQDGTELPPPGL